MATRRQRGAVPAIQPTRASSADAASAPVPPASTSVSMRSAPSGSGTVPSSSPLSARTGPPCRDVSVTRYPRTAERRGRPGRPGEDLVRAHRIERLQAVEGDDHDVALPHGSHSERPV